MSAAAISLALRRKVVERAKACCEYCRVHSGDVLFPHEPDHVRSEKHGGQTTLENIAFAWFHCNRHKGSDLGSVDSETGNLTPLYNPRAQKWSEHFLLHGAVIVPRSAEGRVTVALLKMNAPDRIRVRQALADSARYP